MKKQSFLLTLAVFAGVLWSRSSMACDCMRLPPPGALPGGQVIFAGEVMSVTRQTEDSTTTRPDGSVEITIRFLDSHIRFFVMKAWKGVSTEVFILSSTMSGCEFPFKVGDRYLVFASRKEGFKYPQTSICHRTTELSKAGQLIKSLGPPVYDPTSKKR